MADGFDYGTELVQVDEYKLWPTEGNFTALLDGDMLPYIAGYTTDIMDANRAYRNAAIPGLEAFSFLHEEKFAKLLEQPEFQNKVNQINWLINDWVAKAGADSAIIYMTKSDANFRNDLAFSRPYKGQRKQEKPPFFYELRHYIITMHNAVIADGNEADDLMSIEAWSRHRELEKQGVAIGDAMHKEFCNCAIVSKDKDLGIVPGWFVNPDTGVKLWVDKVGELTPVWKPKEVPVYEEWPLVSGEPMNPDLLASAGLRPDTWSSGAKKGQVKTKRIKVGVQETTYIDKLKGCGQKFFYSQLLTGDQVDNYTGIPGMGPTGAFELLNGAQSEEEMFYIVRDAYKAHYGDGKIEVQNYRGGKAELTAMQLMIEQGRLAHMQTYPGELWRESKNLCPTGVDKVWQSA